MKKNNLTILLVFIGINIYGQSVNFDSLYTEVKKLVFIDAISNRNITATDLNCHPYFTKHLQVKELSSAGKLFSDFKFIEIEYKTFDTTTTKYAYLNLSEGCKILVKSTFERRQVIAYSKSNKCLYKLFGFEHNDFGEMLIQIPPDEEQEMVLKSKKYFFSNYKIAGYDINRLLPHKISKKYKLWFW